MKQNLDTKQDGWYVATEPRKKKYKKVLLKGKITWKNSYINWRKRESKVFFSVHNPILRSNGTGNNCPSMSLNHTSMISKDSSSRLRKCTPLPTTNEKKMGDFIQMCLSTYNLIDVYKKVTTNTLCDTEVFVYQNNHDCKICCSKKLLPVLRK